MGEFRSDENDFSAEEAEPMDDYLSAPDDEISELPETYMSSEESQENVETEEQEEVSEEPNLAEEIEEESEDDSEPSDEELEQVEEEDPPEAAEAATSDSESTEDKYSKIFAPFKAAGKTMQVDNADDALRLMQMGANYSQKMNQLKPHLKTVKMLEQKNLMDPSKLNLLVDAASGDIGAIRKLAEMNDIDLYELSNSNDDSDYTPKEHSISDEDYAFSEVVDELKTTDTYKELVNRVGNDFDDASKLAIKQNPSILKTLNDHIASGLYNDISNEVAQLKALGKVPSNVPDVEIYGRIYQAYSQAIQTPKAEEKSPEQDIVKSDPKVEKQRRAVAKTKKTKAVKKSYTEEDFLSMPDDKLPMFNF